MGRTITIELNEQQQVALENGYRNGPSHAFRVRCQMVLLKAEGRLSSDIAALLGFCEQAVNRWLRRYQQEGLSSL